MAKGLKISFLGGVGEIGKNMYALEYDNEIIVLDCGLGFPTDDMPGIDCVVQDLTYLVQNKDKVKAYVITHGHEDHIGGIPYALAQVPAPIYGSRLTLALIENKLREHPGIKVKDVVVRPRSCVQIGQFHVEFIHVNHNIAGSFAFAITTPVGVVFFTGDFKVDYTPVDGQITDITRIGEIGRKGVALMMCECTNIERKGHTMSETAAGESLDRLFGENKDRRLFVSTFASNVHRVQQLLDLSVKHNRKIAFAGRSMINVSDTAIKIGELRAIRPEQIIDINTVGNYKDSEVLIVLTGSQGEPGSALVRMSRGEFNRIQVGGNDTIVFASSPIPGNEDSVNQTINNLIKCGAKVIYESLQEVHASGHAYEDEFKLMITLVNPHYFVPVHGEYKHMKKNAELAEKLGVQKRNILIPDLGDSIELTVNNLKRVGCIPSGAVLIDGSGTGATDSNVLRDRMTLAEEGICVVSNKKKKKTGAVLSGPNVVTRGLLYNEELLEHMDEARKAILDSLNNSGMNLAKDDAGDIRTQIRKDVQGYFQKVVKRRPLVITMLEGF
jgi:ribonuclease J